MFRIYEVYSNCWKLTIKHIFMTCYEKLPPLYTADLMYKIEGNVRFACLACLNECAHGSASTPQWSQPSIDSTYRHNWAARRRGRAFEVSHNELNWFYGYFIWILPPRRSNSTDWSTTYYTIKAKFVTFPQMSVIVLIYMAHGGLFFDPE